MNYDRCGKHSRRSRRNQAAHQRSPQSREHREQQTVHRPQDRRGQTRLFTQRKTLAPTLSDYLSTG